MPEFASANIRYPPHFLPQVLMDSAICVREDSEKAHYSPIVIPALGQESISILIPV